LRAGTSPNRQYFLKNLKELIKKGEDEAAGKFPEDSLFFSKQRLEEGRRWKVKRKLIMTIKNQDLTPGSERIDKKGS